MGIVLDDRSRTSRRRMALVAGLFLLGFLVLGILLVQVWEYSNSTAFCARTCHDVHPEEPIAYQDSYHAEVKCTECHVGRVSTVAAIGLKVTHLRYLRAVLIKDYDRPTGSQTLRPANESCEQCHWPQAFHGDTVREIKHYLPDETNTETRTYLILKTGAVERESGLVSGIHWHIANPVEYIAADDDKQQIRWVRATLRYGRIMEYQDASNPLSAEDLATAEKRMMGCVDCHNEAGHPFPSPEAVVDQALADGRLSRSLPFIAKVMVDLLAAPYDSQGEALAAVDSLQAWYEQNYPEIVAAQPSEVAQAVRLARELIVRLVFEEPGITWQSFADNSGHKEFAGCFRCHDGKHFSPDGESIRLQCNLCHSLPVTVKEAETAPALPLASVREPASHRATNFVADHRYQAGAECAICHGPLRFGQDNSGFCANSACHGQAWPMVNLNAIVPHPVALDGAHATVQCYECHQGVRQVASECNACHRPPENHGDGTCDGCHAPAGWAEPRAGARTAAPRILHELSGRDACLACHDPQGHVRPAPANHRAYRNGQCSLCHVGAGAGGAPFEHAEAGFSLQGAHADLECAQCHSDGQFEGTPEGCYACHKTDDHHVGQMGQDCVKCHTPAGWTGASFNHRKTAFALAGRHLKVGCVQCHPGNVYQSTEKACYSCHKADDRHAGQMGQDCAQCHTPSGWPGATFDHSKTAFVLAGQHTKVSCAQCHTDRPYKGTAKVCYSCHKADDRHAGQMGQDCGQCHSPSGWPGASFDHSRTAFALAGTHSSASCAQCHTGQTYKGTPKACYACHQADDRHAGQMGQDCGQCHSPAGWPGASFDHSRTAFALAGQHAKASCARCHPNGVYKGTPKACYACHQVDDRHAGQMGQDCGQCHSPAGWPGATFDHNTTAFALAGKHMAARCVQCHPNSSYKGTPTACYACHKADDRHAGQMDQDCAQCHTPAGWPGVTVDHNRTAFPLTGRHLQVSCAQCHTGGTYPGTPTECSACHAEPAFHSGVLGMACASCHTPEGWIPASFGQPHRFPFGHGSRGDSSCRTCHPGDLRSYTCFSCHEHNPSEIEEKHRKEGVGDFQDCARCHPTGREHSD